MKSLLFSLALAAVPVLAIPPREFGFPETANHTELSIAYTFNGNTTVVLEAQLFGGNITSRQPELAVDARKFRSIAEYNGQYLVLMIDPDAPSPDNPTLRHILHWLAPNMSATTVTTGPLAGQRRLTNSTPAVVTYAPPGPPPASSAHRYILYAFRQPANFSVPAAFANVASNRTFFNVDNFITSAGLGDPAAAQYFYVSRQPSVPGTFVALPGGQFPGGNGAAVIAGSGDGKPGSSPTTSPPTTSPPSNPSQAAAALLKAPSFVGGALGAGLLGMVALL